MVETIGTNDTLAAIESAIEKGSIRAEGIHLRASEVAEPGADDDVVRAGCAWRQLPADFPPWQGVYWHFNQREQARVTVTSRAGCRAGPLAYRQRSG